MKKDIVHPKVQDIAIAVVKEGGRWDVYMLNLKDKKIENVLITSKGYGEKNGEKVKTSTIRRFWKSLSPKSFKKIEPIMENLFGLSNEFWVSFYIGKTIYDKKYVFVAETIKKEHFITVPLINKKGVMIK
ncbi:MAG: hypothetical protein COA57_04790 [Flavobacteriales bacterium]|nr:MAG: hypothetical protein COA57_04790 [Flavobacteriales bacterium]